MVVSLDDLDLGFGGLTAAEDADCEVIKPPPFNDVPVASHPTIRRSTKVHKGILYFDLETTPDYSRRELFELESISNKDQTPGDKLPSMAAFIAGTLDEFKARMIEWNPDAAGLDAIEKAEKTIGKSRKGALDLISDYRNQGAAHRKQMSITPEMNRIVAFGWSIGDGITNSMVIGQNGCTEIDMLERFWTLARTGRVCGFNLLGFDLPTIFTRSIILDVAPSRQFDLKPWGVDVIDLMAKRWPKGPATGLKKLCRMLGIPIPAGDIDGSMVEEMLKTDPAKVGQYVRSDVDLVKCLHQSYSGFFC